jgi:GNAT superfamily N-acetyltransferase
MTLRITCEDQPADDDRQTIRDRLDEWNIAVTGRSDWCRVSILLRDESGAIRGGALGNVWASWLHLDFLWVDEDCRRQGWGARLLEAVEAQARVRGCTHAYLDTFSFQAGPRFYERFGYRIFGVLPGHPIGHTQYFMWRML